MAEERRSYGPGDKADGIDTERLQRPDQRVGRWKEQLGKDQRRDDDVEQKIVRLDHRADRAGDNRAAQLCAVLGIGEPGDRRVG